MCECLPLAPRYERGAWPRPRGGAGLAPFPCVVRGPTVCVLRCTSIDGLPVLMAGVPKVR